jgi:hypothetical protein
VAWFKVDDGFYSHAKVLSIPRASRAAALGTWIICGTWSADKLTDGLVPAHMVEELGGSIDGAEALVLVGLWRSRRGGYLFVNWAEFQPTRENIETQRKSERDRKAAYRASKSGGSPKDVPTGQTRIPNTPTRTRPVPVKDSSSEESSAAKRGTRLADGWTPSADLIAAAAGYAPSVNLATETENFRDWWRAKPGAGGVKLDWDATWRGWMRRSHERNVERGWTPPADSAAGMRVFGGPERIGLD